MWRHLETIIVLWIPDYARNCLQPAPCSYNCNSDYHQPISSAQRFFPNMGQSQPAVFCLYKISHILLCRNPFLRFYLTLCKQDSHLTVKHLHKAFHLLVSKQRERNSHKYLSWGQNKIIRDTNPQLKVTKKTVSLLGIYRYLLVSLCFLTGYRWSVEHMFSERSVTLVDIQN